MRALLVSFVVLGVSCAPPAGVAEVSLTLSPTAFSADITELSVLVLATDEQGRLGKGQVRLTVDVGTVAPAESTTLDAYGTARFVWTCTTGCEAGGRVEAAWARASGSAGTGTSGSAPLRVSKSVLFDQQAQGSTISTLTLKTRSDWRATGSAPPAEWTAATFDDSGWSTAVTVVPEGGTMGQTADSIWDLGPTTTSGSVQVWFRRTFTLGNTIDSASLNFACNDDMEVWLNGTKVISDTDGVTTYRTMPDVRTFLLAGPNLIAATCADKVLPEHGFWGTLTVRSH